MKELCRARKALEEIDERRSAAARGLANTFGKSRAEINALATELTAAEAALATAKRRLALAEVEARLGFAATSRGRALADRLYGLR